MGYITDPTTTIFSIFSIIIPVILLVIAATTVVGKVAVLRKFHEKVMKKIERKEALIMGCFCQLI